MNARDRERFTLTVFQTVKFATQYMLKQQETFTLPFFYQNHGRAAINTYWEGITPPDFLALIKEARVIHVDNNVLEEIVVDLTIELQGLMLHEFGLPSSIENPIEAIRKAMVRASPSELNIKSTRAFVELLKRHRLPIDSPFDVVWLATFFETEKDYRTIASFELHRFAVSQNPNIHKEIESLVRLETEGTTPKAKCIPHACLLDYQNMRAYGIAVLSNEPGGIGPNSTLVIQEVLSKTVSEPPVAAIDAAVAAKILRQVNNAGVTKVHPKEFRSVQDRFNKVRVIPPPFYRSPISLSSPEANVDHSRPAGVDISKEYTHRWDVRGHKRLYLRRGRMPIKESEKNNLTSKGYSVYTYTQPTTEEIALIAQRGKEQKKRGEWLAVKVVWVDAYIKGPEDKPYIPSLKVVKP